MPETRSSTTHPPWRGDPIPIAVVLALLGGLAASASEPVRLTGDGARKMAPTFIDGGQTLVFATHERPNLVSLVQVSCRDGTRERVLPKVVNHQLDPAFSSDGRFLAYSRTATSPHSDLIIRDRREQREVTFRPQDSRQPFDIPASRPMAPAWSSASPTSAVNRSQPSTGRVRGSRCSLPRGASAVGRPTRPAGGRSPSPPAETATWNST